MFTATLLFAAIISAQDKPKPKFPIGKEATYVDGPLDKDGYIDYEAAVNERLGNGITTDKNANVLIWKAIGPKPAGGAVLPPDYFRTIGMEQPPEQGTNIIDLRTFCKDRLKLDPRECDEVEKQYRTSGLGISKEFPQLIAWLRENETPLGIIVDATKHPKYFNPLISDLTDTGRAGLLRGRLPTM